MIVLGPIGSSGIFWLDSIFQGIAVGCNRSVGNGWFTDLVPRESLGKGPALFDPRSGFVGLLDLTWQLSCHPRSGDHR